MSNFKDFANNGCISSSETESVRVKNDNSKSIGLRMQRVLDTDLRKCQTRKDFENYIEKYKKYSDNRAVRVAMEKVSTMQKLTEERRVLHPSNGMNLKPFIFIGGSAVCIIVLYFLLRPSPNPVFRQDSLGGISNHVEVIDEIDNSTNPIADPIADPIVEPISEPNSPIKYTMCPYCSAFPGRCSACGGYQGWFNCTTGEFVDCLVCKGTGECTMCNGTCFIQDFSLQ